MQLILRLASQGLIHGDYNEFNILVYENGKPVLIDFPQMVSIDHPNAREYFERDVACIKTFFKRKFRFEADDGGPKWEDVKRVGKLDFEVEASGFGGKLGEEMAWFQREISVVTDHYRSEKGEEESEEDEDGEGGEEVGRREREERKKRTKKNLMRRMSKTSNEIIFPSSLYIYNQIPIITARCTISYSQFKSNNPTEHIIPFHNLPSLPFNNLNRNPFNLRPLPIPSSLAIQNHRLPIVHNTHQPLRIPNSPPQMIPDSCKSS